MKQEGQLQSTYDLRKAGVSIWLDNITRKMLDDGAIKKYIDEYSVTGLTSNPTIFDLAVSGSDYYDQAISRLRETGITNEELFFEIAIEDIRRAADLFMSIYTETNGLDGFVSIEVSPKLAYHTDTTVQAAEHIFKKVNRPNIYIKIPGTPEGLPAITKCIAQGIPVNVTLLFSPAQYQAAAEAWLLGIEQRIEAGLPVKINSVASVFVSRWDRAVVNILPNELQNKLGIAVMHQVYQVYEEFLASNRMRRVMNFGAIPQRLLWASTGTKDPNASDVMYVQSLIAPFTVNTMPDSTLSAWADHGIVKQPMHAYSDKYKEMLSQFTNAGIDVKALGETLQQEGAAAFVKSWEHLIESIAGK